ncbi:MAG: SH3 domain-containing protein [Christensenellales bacterium]|nr:SH3 domain-containing protein [Christensenellales bacterium]
MKRWLLRCLLLAVCLCGLGLPCAATEKAYALNQSNYASYNCVDFEGELPKALQPVFQDVLRADERILSGSWRTEAHSARSSVLMAVVRSGKAVLIGGRCNDGQWEVCVETDGFFRPEEIQDITVLPDEDEVQRWAWGLSSSHAVLCGKEIWRMNIGWNGRIEPYVLEMCGDEGTRTFVRVSSGHMDVHEIRGDIHVDKGSWRCVVPNRLAAWNREDYPTNVEEAQRYAQEHQPVLEAGQAYISGVNLREKPTGLSRSLGIYSARVTVLGSQPGTQAPWYHVRVGDTEGWVSGQYLLDGSQFDARLYSLSAALVIPARALCETPLFRQPDGEAFARLLPGALMHVLEEQDGWLHVILPKEGELAPLVDWDGVYGYVRADAVVRGKTLTELKWK